MTVLMYILLGVLVAVSIPFFHGLIFGLPETDTETEETEETEVNVNIEDEIAMLEINVERRNEISSILEKELETCLNEKRRIILLSKLNTIDKQTYKDLERIRKLKDLE